MKRKVVIKDLFHEVGPHGSQPSPEIMPVIVAVIIAIAACNL